MDEIFKPEDFGETGTADHSCGIANARLRELGIPEKLARLEELEKGLNSPINPLEYVYIKTDTHTAKLICVERIEGK